MKSVVAGIFSCSITLAAVAFGPDTTSTGVNTGQGVVTPGLICDSNVSPTACNGYLASDLDGTMLDVTVWLPLSPMPHPLVVGIHGWGGSKRSMNQYAQRITDRGFALLSYSARGFGSSFGQTNLADVNVEAVDLRSMIGAAADDPQLQIDPSAVGVFGASYGGAHSYLAAIRPTFTTTHGRTVVVRAIAPLVPWSELTAALRPNGSSDDPIDPAGGFKFSFVEALYIGGCRDMPVCSNYPEYLKLWNTWMTLNEPNNTTPIDRQIVDGFSGYRSIYWQSTNRVPIFLAQGWTDDLFPAPEALRMYRALKAVDPNYPIALYLGDSGHPRAATKPGEVDYIIDQVLAWFDWYLQGEGTQPPLDVQAAIRRPKNVPFRSADVIRVPTYDDLATSTLTKSFHGVPQVLTFNPANTSGVVWDPIIMIGAEELQYNPAPDVPPDFMPGDVAVYEMPLSQSLLIAGQPSVTMMIHQLSPLGFREQLNVRLYDVKPDGTKQLVTRGTYTIDTSNRVTPIGSAKVTVATYGNVWQADANDTLRLEITNVDSPYIAPSKVPSITAITSVTLTLPIR
jgi:ABC-2 type transport system ATP-binding protein